MRRRYSTDLTDAEWKCIEPYIRSANKRGRPKIHSLRHVLDAVFYVLRSGCAWRLLPCEFPPWRVVYYWFRKWRIEGTLERLNAALREQLRIAQAQTLTPRRVSSTPSRPRPPGWAANREDTTAERRYAVVSAIFWWTLKGWSLRPRYTAAPRFPTKM